MGRGCRHMGADGLRLGGGGFIPRHSMARRGASASSGAAADSIKPYDSAERLICLLVLVPGIKHSKAAIRIGSHFDVVAFTVFCEVGNERIRNVVLFV